MEAAQARVCELQASSRVSPSGVGTTTAVQVVQQKTAKPERNSCCYRCGKPGHSPDHCFYRKQSCRRCGKRGHIAKVCGSKEAHLVEQELSEQREEAVGGAAASDQFLFNIKTIKSSKGNITVDLVKDGKDICMELDTGAALSILSETKWNRIFPKQALNHSSVRLKTYTGEPLIVIGEKDVLVKYQRQKHVIPVVVVAGKSPSLFGRNWAKPSNGQQLRAFLGLVYYYGRFISQLSTITHPLNQLLKKGTRWV